MIVNATLILAIIALLIAIASALNPQRAPLWIAVVLLAIVALIGSLPLR